MGRRKMLIEAYASDLMKHCRMEPDMELLEKVAVGCGPAIFNPTEEFVTEDTRDIQKVRRNFLVRKLTIPDGPELLAAIQAAIRSYGTPDIPKYRAVLFYLLVKRFGKEAYYR